MGKAGQGDVRLHIVAALAEMACSVLAGLLLMLGRVSKTIARLEFVTSVVASTHHWHEAADTANSAKVRS
eukprot:CAMPEP_0172927016 /NCGR_PEP_ID=MMETSP1075-20121228/216697_1 /TAXON_ID=2916 /ORGANISM="Ceratium fusus, Strain PA161109" /LENGTH=69 /DNA_ID=CAMNT_0013788195 /DNA_START=511 /DNA_END=720 /DNA_ORIENTATION=-